jgi:hypothetical protein
VPPGNFKRLPAGKWLQMPGQCFYAIRSAILRRPPRLKAASRLDRVVQDCFL